MELEPGDMSERESEGEDDSLWDIQAAHTSKTAGMVYGWLLTEGIFETDERRGGFRQISEQWH